MAKSYKNYVIQSNVGRTIQYSKTKTQWSIYLPNLTELIIILTVSKVSRKTKITINGVEVHLTKPYSREYEIHHNNHVFNIFPDHVMYSNINLLFIDGVEYDELEQFVNISPTSLIPAPTQTPLEISEKTNFVTSGQITIYK